MDVKIIATRTCSHRPNIERELQDLGVQFEVIFVEEDPGVVTQYAIRHSPNVVINDEVVFRGQPTEEELRSLLSRYE